ncbi:sensor histidine kinase [Lachnoclostridium sp. Marseille-P6806]|uniref:sensor histidine kinase n=1 Tax=Lachnoclostridium sp. Marseille-P6806 TaxID=2364793 RepID=UPI001F5F6281|nr:DUF4118 domain-containing protein [Lachnoclostridium sp. Marseille-P6806]
MPLVFVLAVVVISRLTDGYFYGILGSVVAVVGVNYVFTYPYFRLGFTPTGYPLTFVIMLAVSVLVCALTTQIKQQEQVTLDMEREKMRGNLLRAVSHDIRTPLTSIVGSASAILESGDALDSGQIRALLKDIQTEAQWLTRIVENILSITRMNNADTELQTSEELAEEIVGSAAVKFRKRYPDAAVAVQVPAEALLVPMDPVLIEQVLVNLLDNAYIHGKKPSQIRIDVTARPGEARFCVEDNGAGIDPGVLPHLFDGTLPLKESDSDSRSSMRIGLSVCMSISRRTTAA